MCFSSIFCLVVQTHGHIKFDVVRATFISGYSTAHIHTTPVPYGLYCLHYSIVQRSAKSTEGSSLTTNLRGICVDHCVSSTCQRSRRWNRPEKFKRAKQLKRQALTVIVEAHGTSCRVRVSSGSYDIYCWMWGAQHCSVVSHRGKYTTQST